LGISHSFPAQATVDDGFDELRPGPTANRLATDLTRGREYEIRTRARYAHGWSRWGDRLFTTTVT